MAGVDSQNGGRWDVGPQRGGSWDVVLHPFLVIIRKPTKIMRISHPYRDLLQTLNHCAFLWPV